MSHNFTGTRWIGTGSAGINPDSQLCAGVQDSQLCIVLSDEGPFQALCNLEIFLKWNLATYIFSAHKAPEKPQNYFGLFSSYYNLIIHEMVHPVNT